MYTRCTSIEMALEDDLKSPVRRFQNMHLSYFRTISFRTEARIARRVKGVPPCSLWDLGGRRSDLHVLTFFFCLGISAKLYTSLTKREARQLVILTRNGLEL